MLEQEYLTEDAVVKVAFSKMNVTLTKKKMWREKVKMLYRAYTVVCMWKVNNKETGWESSNGSRYVV